MFALGHLGMVLRGNGLKFGQPSSTFLHSMNASFEGADESAHKFRLV